MRKLPRPNTLYVLLLLAATPLTLHAQAANPQTRQSARDEASSGQVLMLEEIRIQVAPELPTVVVSIPRQKPVIRSVSLSKDANDLITAGNVQVKPRLADLQVNRIDEPEKILAKPRAQ